VTAAIDLSWMPEGRRAASEQGALRHDLGMSAHADQNLNIKKQDKVRRDARITALVSASARKRRGVILPPSLPVIRTENASISAAISGNAETPIRLWLNARSEHTWRAHEADIGGLLATVAKPIASTTLADLQTGIESFEGGCRRAEGERSAPSNRCSLSPNGPGYCRISVDRRFAIKGGPRCSPATCESVVHQSAPPEPAGIRKTMRAAAVLAGR
jgi:hypothetical protein